jgi:hypothetical protein
MSGFSCLPLLADDVLMARVPTLFKHLFFLPPSTPEAGREVTAFLARLQLIDGEVELLSDLV